MADSLPVLLTKEINAENMVFIDVPPKDGANPSRSVRIKYQHSSEGEPERMLIQSAKMKLPFGISNNKKFCTGKDGVVDWSKVKWDLQLSFQGEERSKRIQRFRAAMEEIDKKIKDVVLPNADEWIPLPDEEDDDGNFKSVSHDAKTVRRSYKSALKRFKPKKNKPDDIFPDTFKISISWDMKPVSEEDKHNPEFSGNPKKGIEFYDEQGTEMHWSQIPSGCEVVALYEINGMWCSTSFGSVSPSVKLVQLQVFKPKRLKGFQIKYEAEEDEDDQDEDEDSIDEEDEEEVVSDDE